MANPFQSTVSKEIIKEFLEHLSTTDVDASVIKSLNETILEQGKSAEASLRSALFESGDDD